MAQIRSFIAIELSPTIKVKIEEIQNKLKSSTTDVRWVRPEGIHLTLKFLGNIEEEKIPELSDAVTQCISDISSFSLTVRTLGAFPNERNPKVIWFAASDDSGNDRNHDCQVEPGKGGQIEKSRQETTIE